MRPRIHHEAEKSKSWRSERLSRSGDHGPRGGKIDPDQPFWAGDRVKTLQSDPQTRYASVSSGTQPVKRQRGRNKKTSRRVKSLEGERIG